MPQPRRTAWALIAALMATSAFAVAPVAAMDPLSGPLAQNGTLCTTGPTHWTDDMHPPQTVRVLRSRGPNKGKIDVVSLWKYVGRVVRTEYSSGGAKPYPWMQVGAIAVKEYAWFYAMHWRGGKVPIYDTSVPPIIVGYDCYDLKDTTADQIYNDLKADPAHPDVNDPLHWMPDNVPSASNLVAMRETWHMSIRKWQAKKNRSRLFLTGYRSGRQKPCGADSTGFKIYQKSLRDCGNKNLTLEETLRKYFESGLQIVDTRLNDVMDDSGDWRGDLSVLYPSGSNTAWKLYQGTSTSFDPGPGNTWNVDFSKVLGQGVGNVDAASSSATDNGPNDSRMLADLLLLVDTGAGSRELRVARATGNGGQNALGSFTSYSAPNNSQRLMVADFNGDMAEDAGMLVDQGAGQATLRVMLSSASSGFAGATDWWAGPLDLTATNVFVAAGDVNGDEKADLIMRDPSTGVFSVAASRPSCSPIGVFAKQCAPENVGAPGLNAAAPALTTFNTAATHVKLVVGDYDRDGRDDVVAVTENGSGIQVLGMRGKTDGTFMDAQVLWSSNSMAFSEVIPTAMNVNYDGMADLALLVKDSSGTDVQWLKTVERTNTTPATMTPAGAPVDAGLTWHPTNRAF